MRAFGEDSGFGGEAGFEVAPVDAAFGGGFFKRFAVVGFGVEYDGVDHGGVGLIAERLFFVRQGLTPRH